jgi:hypothetical protein
MYSSWRPVSSCLPACCFFGPNRHRSNTLSFLASRKKIEGVAQIYARVTILIICTILLWLHDSSVCILVEESFSRPNEKKLRTGSLPERRLDSKNRCEYIGWWHSWYCTWFKAITPGNKIKHCVRCTAGYQAVGSTGKGADQREDEHWSDESRSGAAVRTST